MVRSIHLADHLIRSGILDGAVPVGQPRPIGRQRTTTIGVARPILREALHRLANEGWPTIANGCMGIASSPRHRFMSISTNDRVNQDLP